jgi:hypothetical protein
VTFNGLSNTSIVIVSESVNRDRLGIRQLAESVVRDRERNVMRPALALGGSPRENAGVRIERCAGGQTGGGERQAVGRVVERVGRCDGERELFAVIHLLVPDRAENGSVVDRLHGHDERPHEGFVIARRAQIGIEATIGHGDGDLSGPVPPCRRSVGERAE